MKINIITNNNGYGLSQDYKILSFILKKKYKKLDINLVNYYNYKSEIADINIFLEVVSNIHIQNAKYNILIPNQEWYHKSWINYLNKFDKIFLKTNYSFEVFKSFVSPEKLSYVSWKSNDRLINSVDKDYKKFIHICGKSEYRQTELILDCWEEDYPHLLIIINKDYVKIDFKKQKNIEYIFDRVDDNKFDKLINEYGIHICCSETEGFGHYINEAKLCKSVVITTDANPMNELINSEIGFLVKSKKKKK